MASSADLKDNPSFKCRRCRQFLFSAANVLQSALPDGIATPQLHGNQSRSDCALWYISNDAIPPWIQSAIGEARWTKGKLACPKCRGRLGSFDFLTPSSRRSADRRQARSCIHIISSRVDREASQAMLAYLRRANQSQVKGQKAAASPVSTLETVAVTTGSDHLRENGGSALPKGHHHFNRVKLEARSLSDTSVNADQDLCHENSVNSVAEDYSKKHILTSFKGAINTSNFEPASRNSELAIEALRTPNNRMNCEVRATLRVPVNRSALRTALCRDGPPFSEKTLGNSHIGPKPSNGNTCTNAEYAPCTPGTSSVDEIIQFGFCTPEHDVSMAKRSRTGHALCDVTMLNDSDTQSDPSTMKTDKFSDEEVTGRIVQSQQSNQSTSLCLYSEDLFNKQPVRNAQAAQRQSFNLQHSDEGSDSEQASSGLTDTLNTPLPETWQGVLDELLSDLDRDRDGTSPSTQKRSNNINQLEGETDTDEQQDGNHDNSHYDSLLHSPNLCAFQHLSTSSPCSSSPTYHQTPL